MSDRKKIIDKLLDTTSFRGATGHFPEGKLNAADEGGLQFGVGIEDGNVVLNFGTDVKWLALSPQMAADMASALLRRARQVARAEGITIEFRM